ncbi:MAG: energy-coupling factor transporter ATPase, partial [Propionibacteriaceae bacterium]|nr:energy-coupling factor transporter ATPase [Propionibacteriaceae bacterium]
GYVFQNPFTQMSGVSPTVFDELAYGLGNLGVPPDDMRRRVESMLEATKLNDLRDRNPFELSGGQQQRVALASILVMDQPVLVIDEPTSQLDPETTDAMFELIAQAHSAGRTIILVEHKMEQVAQFSDRVIVMESGRIVLNGTPAEVFSDPRCAKAGVRMPESMYLRQALVSRGIELPAHPLSVHELIADIATATGRTPDPATNAQDDGKGGPQDDGKGGPQDDGAFLGHPARSTSPSRHPARSTSPSRHPARSEAESQDLLVDVHRVRFAYPNGVEALRDVSLAVDAGESLAIIGQNGAGKTTLAKLINGLLKPTSGEVLISSEPTKKWTAARTARRVGYVFQNPDDQIFNKSVRAEVAYALSRLKVMGDEATQRVDDALALTGLTRQADTNPYDLPLSVRKFVTIASVVALDTDVVLLDEPTAGQDLIGLNRLIAILRELRSRNKAVITITHDMEFVSQNFARTIVMANGQVLDDGPTDSVFYDRDCLREAMVNEPAFVQVARRFAGASAGLSMDALVAALKG